MKTRITSLVAAVVVSCAATGQKLSETSVMKTVRKVADHIVANTTYLYYDKEKGIMVEDLQKYGYTKNIVPQNGYNDWKYWTGVLHLGFNRLGEYTDIPRYVDYSKRNYEFFFKDREYLQSVFDGKDMWNFPVAQSLSISELDHCGAMGASLIELYTTDKKLVYWQYINRAAEHISTRQVRLTDGTLARHHPHAKTVWADDLYMSVPFLARMAKLTGKNCYFDDAIRQVLLFNEYLYDKNAGLMWHAYYDDLKVNGGAYWGRCNGWMMVAMADLLCFLPKNYQGRDKVEFLLNRQIREIARYQSPSGLWHQVLDRNDSYLETSCTAMFTYAIALSINQGWLDKRYSSIAFAGWMGVESTITNEGEVLGICAGTGIGDNIGFYYSRPTPVNDIHGLGAIILAGIEVAKLLH